MPSSFRVDVIPESEDHSVYRVVILVDGEEVDERDFGTQDEADIWGCERTHVLDGLPDDEDPDPSLPRM